MKIFTLTVMLIALLFISIPASAAEPAIPKLLTAQVQHLEKLLSDGNAVGYPKATMAQNIKINANENITLTVFTLEGFGGGNNWSQYLAVFSQETTEKGKPYFTLIDFLRIGGGGWRTIERLDAKISASKKDETAFAISTLENTDEDPPNFPSKKSSVKLILKNGRLSEQHSIGWGL